MKMLNNQKGVGLVEVLVSLLILALGIMGFAALQYRAMEATSESSARVEAINLARDFAERLRVNRGAIETYKTELKKATDQQASSKICSKEMCSAADMADFDVAQLTQKAAVRGMSVNLENCQGNSDERSCIYIAWGDTAPTNGDANGEGNCTTSTAYDPSSTCLIMEVY
ncbi:type IV pilus modification protein PilV [Acinetobacter sp. WCHAc010052]|uniref:type IV pilus modification protein PilV n=1 Tax=Acinetobacter sp. WCHAc010052 TaxID=2004647 RepID=UPI00148BEEDC|nr:type IV pilus modification protein PilV [Acinetobacter sp. WCHAc010052]